MRRPIVLLVLTFATLPWAGGAAQALQTQARATTVAPGQTLSARAPGHLDSPGDFNGDGYPDLAIGVPEDDVGTIEDAGTVYVIYSSPKGLRRANNQFWTQDSEGLIDDAEKGEFFGRTLATGDFNADGYDDLAIAAIRERVGTANHAGSVTILYGSAARLTSTGTQFWTQDSEGIIDQAETGDLFGAGMHSADWNNDGYDDLAVGPYNESFDGAQYAGAVHILFGSATGITADGNEFWTQDTPGVLDQTEAFDEFGRQLADGDFDGDGFPDLAIGVRLEEVDGVVEAGAVNVLYGSLTGLTTDGNQFFTQNTPGMAGDGAEPSDWFGRPVTVGNFDNDAYDDLLIGSRYEDVGSVLDAGSSHALYGSAAGLSTARSQFWTQDSPGVIDEAEPEEWFGHQSAAGDFNKDGYDDVAIGPMAENLGAIDNAGAINVLYGSPAGLTADGTQFWTQDSPGIPEDAEDGDLFSFYVWSKDFNRDGYDDLAASAPFDGVGVVEEAGLVITMFGGPSGLRATKSQLWTQDLLSGDGSEFHDLMGGILA
jgi:hypothetical protein